MENPKILIVDDAAFMRNMLGNSMREIGYNNLFFAEDGFVAVEMSEEIKPDFITLDISMPGMDGLEAIKKILEVSPLTKIIMVSAVSGQEAIKQAIRNGAVDFIKKPFNVMEIEDVLKRHMD